MPLSNHLQTRFRVRLICCLILFSPSATSIAQLTIEHDHDDGKIEVFRSGSDSAILTQNARPDFRPYLHPIMSPDGKGVLTQSNPDHHKHQTGLYWGFTRVNQRDYFHHPADEYWKRISATVLKPESTQSDPTVSWQTVYDLLDDQGKPVLRETQTWTMQDNGDRFVLDLNWNGKSSRDVTIGEYDYGGLFLRMPWTEKTKGRVLNSARQQDQRAEGQRAVWLDVGMEIDGLDDWAHIAIFDHPDNGGFPTPWRVDGQMGVGPVRARLGDWKIPANADATFRHQLQIYTGDLSDVELTTAWSKFSGQAMAWAQWHLAQVEGKQAEFLTPEKAVESMTLQDGYDVNVFAAEPMMTQPMAFCWDDRGRLWIAENRDYESRQTGFSGDGESRILILEDTDRDGVADTKKVFLEGIPFPAGIAVGMGGLWLGAPPNLLFVPDANQDDRADMDDIEVRLTGWGIRDRHETLNSFHWGPDGWLYGCQGFATPSKVGKPKGQGKIYQHNDPFPENVQFAEEPVDINGGVWRYHPTQERFEVVAHGFSNPWGIDYDDKGQLFVTACVIPHLWHVIPGGIYHRQGGSHFNPHVYADIRTIADHGHRSAHGGARVYQSDTFPKDQHNRIFMANIHEHAVLSDTLEKKGSGYVGHHGGELLHANNAQWVGFSVEVGPDGGLYILDWHDGNICGSEVLNKDTGRVFRIMPQQTKIPDWPNRFADLGKLTDLQLAEFQTSPSNWHARRARTILQHRATARAIDADAVASLKQTFAVNFSGAESASDRHKLRAFWSLHTIGALTETDYLDALSGHGEYVGGWAIQMICESNSPSQTAIDRLVQLGHSSNTTPFTRLYLSIAMQRLGASAFATEGKWRLAELLAKYSDDANDHNLPKMIWFGLEPLVTANPERALALAQNSKIPVLTRHISRRLTSEGMLKFVVNSIGANTPAQRELLLGMRDGLTGRYDLKAPENWSQVYRQLRKKGGESSSLALFMSVRFGDQVAAKALLETLTDSSATVSDRTMAIRGLADRKRVELKNRLLDLLDDDVMRTEAIRAIAAFDDNELGSQLLRRFADFDTANKLESVIALSSRSNYGRLLTDAIKSGQVPRSEVPAYVARALQRVVGNGFLEVWGPVGGTENHTERFDKYRTLLTDDRLAKANLNRGRLVFNKTCQACHKLYGEGGAIGPDITGSNRTNLDYLLGNILTPSADIQDAYRMQLVLLDDGRMLSGIPATESQWNLELRVANQNEPVTIPKSQIEDRETAKTSMMPEGLMENLSESDALDLIAYLRHLEQVPLPAPSER